MASLAGSLDLPGRSQASPTTSYEPQHYNPQLAPAARQEGLLPEALSLEHADIIRAQLQASLSAGHSEGHSLIAALRVGQQASCFEPQQSSTVTRRLSLPSLGSSHAFPSPRRLSIGKHGVQFSASTDVLPSHARTADGSVNTLYKTEMCRSWQQNGSCRYGNKCQFAHGQHEIRIVLRHPKYKTELCRTFTTNGSCPYGQRCRFIHLPSSARMRASIFWQPQDSYLKLARQLAEQQKALAAHSSPTAASAAPPITQAGSLTLHEVAHLAMLQNQAASATPPLQPPSYEQLLECMSPATALHAHSDSSCLLEAAHGLMPYGCRTADTYEVPPYLRHGFSI